MLAKIRDTILKTIIVFYIFFTAISILSIWEVLPSDIFGRSVMSMVLLLVSGFIMVSATLVAEGKFSAKVFLPFLKDKKHGSKIWRAIKWLIKIGLILFIVGVVGIFIYLRFFFSF